MMQRSTQILLTCLVVTLVVVGPSVAENKPSIASAEFLSVLAKNVATVLSPTLVEELQVGRPNRTAVNATNIQSIPTTLPIPKDSETTEVPLKSLNLEADTVRSAQTQSEVGTGNHGFPFNYDDNYRYNYPGINSQGLQRPDFSSGLPFGNNGYYNPDPYRSYASQTTAERNPRPSENVLQSGDPAGGVSPVENVVSSQPGRNLDSLDPSSVNFERYRHSERFPFNNQYSGGFGNFQNFPFAPERLHDGRFHNNGRFNPYTNNLHGNGNLPVNANYQNPIGNNYPRHNFQSFSDPFQQRQHNHATNSFDFLSSQRFQNPYDNYPRSLQRGPNLSEFYPSHYVPGLRDLDILGGPSTKVGAKKTEQTASTELTAKTTKLEASGERNSSGIKTTTDIPEVLSIEGQIRFGNLFLPVLDDYSDLKFRPDGFGQYASSTGANNDNNNSNANENRKNNKTNGKIDKNNKNTKGNGNDV